MRLAAVALAAGLLLAAATPASEWEDHARAGEEALARGDQARAELELELAFEAACALPADDPRLERSLELLAALAESQGRRDRAQPLYELLLVAREHRLGRDSAELLGPLVAAGRVALAAGDVPGGAAHLRRYVEVADASGAAEPAELWQVMGLLARMGTLQKDAASALLYQRRAVDLMAAAPPADAAAAVEQTKVLESLATMEIAHGAPAAAESLLARSVELHLSAGAPEAAVAALARAAETALGSNQLDLTERLVERLLALSPGLDVAIAARATLAEVAWRRLPAEGAPGPALDAAVARLEQLYEVQRLTRPPGDPDLQQTLARLVSVARRRGDGAAAVDAQLKLVLARRAGSGEELAAALADLVELELAAGQLEAAASTGADLVRALDGLPGPPDPRLAGALERQAELLARLGRDREARACRARLRELRRER